MYGKIFASMYDGTLVEDWQTRLVFIDMIVLCDPDGYLDMTPEALSRRTNVPLDIIKKAIKELEASDLKSRSNQDNGARIIRTDEHRDWGWQIVNHEKYKALQDMDTVRAQTKERTRKYRERIKANVTVGDGLKRMVTDGNGEKRHTDINTNTTTNIKSILAQKSTKVDPFEESFIRFWNAYPRKMAKQAASKAWSKIEATEVDLLLERLEAFKQSHEWTKDDGNFIPYPATWLNGRRWEDEIKNANGRPPAPTDPNDPYYTKDWSEDL